ncbi:unnamed protein product [Spirodela intermedia]|uniref:GRF-type domain-containing protein n=1 Tax=Spirodela intermedia TaxID=51605 RepID=A0A7I8JYE7_SPIIN|nr:unnamed protein product [Spirodela intermedia]
MRRDHEASLGGFKSKAFQYNIRDAQNSLNTIGVFPELKFAIDIQRCGTLEYDNAPRRETSVPLHEDYNRQLYQQDFSFWPTFHPEFQKVEQNQWTTVENQFYPVPQGYPCPIESRVQYLPFRTYFPGYPQAFHAQEFQYFVVVDFEATCDKEKNPHPQEIIEFPSVLVNSMTGQLEASFQTYVRPAYHQNLTDFCKELTGIQQIQVDRGVPLGEALFMHDRWLEDKGIKNTNFAIVTWSSWDCRVMLESECRYKRIRKPPYFNRWINLKVPFQEVFGGVRCNLKEAVQLAGLVWEGRAHCGLDDARNTARLLSLLMRRGFRLSITDSLMWHAGERPPARQQQPERAANSSPLPPAPTPPPQRLKQLLAQATPFHPCQESREASMRCFCGVMSCKRMVRKPGPKHGRFFFGCGNWTTTRGAVCPYFEWASS